MIFGASAMQVVVFQEILDLCERAATDGLTQQQEQPVNVLFLRIFKRRLDAVVLSAMLAFWELRPHPNLGCPFVHLLEFLVNEFQHLSHIVLQIKNHLELVLAPLALHLPLDAVDPVL